VTGVSVVSSVNRGAADLHLDGGEILFTTGFPALSPAQGLTHGVHGIGDRIAISVTTSPDVMDDVDRYVELLARAVGS
ncbi:WS/DGAT domain-containing protein, partial [Gordonia terrae]